MKQDEVIVVLWKQNDFGLYGRRVDMLVRQMLKRSGSPEIHVIEPPMDAKVLAESLNAPLDTQKPYVAKLALEKSSNSLWPSNLIFMKNIYYRSVSEYDSSVDFLTSQLKSKQEHGAKITVVAYPFLEHIESLVPIISLADRLVVDYVDDNRNWHKRFSPRRKRIGDQYKELANSSTAAVTNNRHLAKRIYKLAAKRLDVIPNEYLPLNFDLPSEPSPKYRAFSSLSGPVAAYIGNFEDKLDVIGLQKLVRAFPEMNFVLIGSNHNGLPLEILTKYKNVHFFGPVPETEIGNWMSKIDVGLIPHKVSLKTKAMDPMKLSFYHSFAVPVLIFSRRLHRSNSPGITAYAKTTAGRRRALEQLLTQEPPAASAGTGYVESLVRVVLSPSSN